MNIYQYNVNKNLYTLQANDGKNISNNLGGKIEMIAIPYGWCGDDIHFKKFDISDFKIVARR